MGNRRWTADELAELEDRYGVEPAAAIAARLSRTVAAVYERAGKLGLGPQRPADVLTANEVMHIVGRSDYPAIQRWVRDGWLRAERRPAAYGAARRRPEWWVRARDLETFLTEHQHAVDRDDVDPAWRQFVPERWITLVEAFRRGAAHPNILENAVKAGLVPEARQRGVKGTRWCVPERLVPVLTEARRRMTPDAEHRRLVLQYDRLQRRGRLGRGRSRMVAAARASAVGGRSGTRPEPVEPVVETSPRDPQGACREGHPRLVRNGPGRWICRECASRRRGRRGQDRAAMAAGGGR